MEHAIDGGVDSLFLAGTTAEFPALTVDEVTAIVKAGLDLVGPERVIAHVGGASARQAQELTRRVVDLGVTALAAITPYYLPASPAAVLEYFTAVRETAADAKLYAYLFPDRTGVHLDSDETAALVEALDLEGIKLSGLDTDFVAQSVLKLSDRRQVYSGSDGSISRVFSVGGAGVVSGVSSAFPLVFRHLADALEAGDAAGEHASQAEVDRAVALVGPSIRALKTALVALGVISSEECRMALDRLDPGVPDLIVEYVEEYRADVE
ncbi:4-hydroxy-tetrahydrodipicolinate synthase [soil metagenome]